MKKIMFNDRYGLTEAVLSGYKTMTRRVVNTLYMTPIVRSDGILQYVERKSGSYQKYIYETGKIWLVWCPFKIGDVVAVAQSYHTLNKSGFIAPEWLDHTCEGSAGYENKMFIRANLMPHQIRITNIKVECLQDINNEDCIKEGVLQNFGKTFIVPGIMENQSQNNKVFDSPRDAFADLIDRISGKGTWQSNPWVFVYTFELIK